MRLDKAFDNAPLTKAAKELAVARAEAVFAAVRAAGGTPRFAHASPEEATPDTWDYLGAMQALGIPAVLEYENGRGDAVIEVLHGEERAVFVFDEGASRPATLTRYEVAGMRAAPSENLFAIQEIANRFQIAW